MSNNLGKLIENGKIDLYEYLEVSPTATEGDIRRQYRKKALIFHPDKSTGNEEQFNLLSKIYEILIDSQLRSDYDRIRLININKGLRSEKLDDLTKKFRSELARAENEFRNRSSGFNSHEEINTRQWKYNINQLKEEGLRKRRALEVLTNGALKIDKVPVSYVSFQDLPVNEISSFLKNSRSNIVTVLWKSKPKLEGLINAEVLTEIMSIFGSVKSCVVIGKVFKYESANVEFFERSGAQRAVKHNFKTTAAIWEGTKVRKLASLLRECNFAGSNAISSKLDQTIERKSEDNIEAILHKLIQK
ncbi:uncharacterized protein PRCAT00003587001 [Priceomyces carsonii]|uniref:uncharacterized protein n=1 Tax=Priceomyces carsonii TaxID=28549 RepID=UPI002ED95CDF|nr:unnamed protein product [Priceomyces carsonii]